jgi:exodeoxyribonuclease VII small subunit
MSQNKVSAKANENAASTKYADIAELSFETALKELEAIVRRLEAGQGELESSIEDYARGTALKEHCMKKLNDARLKVEQIVRKSDGTLTTAEFEGA